MQYFDYPDDNLLIYGHFEPWLVLLSILIAIFTSSMALHLATQVRLARLAWRLPILLAGSITLGGGVWSMHFIGMLAFDLCTGVTYDPGLTMVSMLPSIAASWVALEINSRPTISMRQLLFGGLLMGAGIGAMHYIGMAAMVMAPLLRYDAMIFALSLVVAVALAMLALWIRFGLRRVGFASLSPLQLNVVAGTVMGLAIAGMHYTGMMAARFVPPAGLQLQPGASQPLVLALSVAVATVSITSLVVAVELILKYRQQSLTLRASEMRVRAILDTAADGVIIVDAKRRIVAVNPAIERIFGWRSDELIGRDAFTLMPPSWQRHNNQLSMSDAELGVGHEVEIMHKDGRALPVRVAMGHVRLPQQEELFVSCISDISERVAMERALMLAKEKAEQAAAARTAFLANMSHEIRTPMNAIIGFSDVLMGTELAPEQRHHLAVISSSARSLLHLLNDVLDSAKLERGKLALERQDFSLPELLDAVLSALGMQARRKGLELGVDIGADVGDYHIGAPDRIRQVLTNLIGNAIKFTEQGRVDVAVRTGEPGHVLFSITDTGIGIAPDRIDAIFEPFTQADATMTRRFGGTGLGTTISKQLVELMGGWIRARSEPGKGSCFEFSLPLEAGSKPVARSENALVPLPPLRILAVDDVEQNLELLKLMLERHGHDVSCASDGAEAVMQIQQQRFDLVLMDMQMPRMDGLVATRHIRDWQSRNGQPPVPVIALTASVLNEDRMAARNAGMEGFCSKPVDIGLLTREIARVLALDLPAEDATPAARRNHVVLDWDAGIGRWGDEAVYGNELTAFAARHEQLPAQLQAVLARGDFAALAQHAHGARGVAANLAINGVAVALAQFEHAARNSDANACSEALQLLTHNLQQFRTELATRMQRHRASAGAAAPAPDLVLFGQALDALHAAAAANECDDEALAQLQRACTPQQAQWARHVAEAFNEFDFARAQQLLRADADPQQESSP